MEVIKNKKIKIKDHSLLLVDFFGSCTHTVRQLQKGLSVSRKIKTLDKFYASRFKDTKAEAINSLHLLEKKQRALHHKNPEDYNPKIFEKKVKKLNSLVGKYNNILKSSNLKNKQKKDEQKKVLNKMHSLVYNNKRIPLFTDVLNK